MQVSLIEIQELYSSQGERWREVYDHTIAILSADYDEESGQLVLTLDEEDADTWGIYPILVIAPNGSVAEYQVAIPFYYQSFADLITASAVKTIAS